MISHERSFQCRATYPAEIVLHPDWWNAHEGIVFDEDFFFHPVRRAEDESRMEKALFERWGEYGLGADHDSDVPAVGAVNLAAGFLLSGMLGCRIAYAEDAAPQVIPADLPDLRISEDDAFSSPIWKKFLALVEKLKAKHGQVRGDVNWGGVLNIALDLRGQSLLMDFYDRPAEVAEFFTAIRNVIERATRFMEAETGTTSISVNRITRFFPEPVFLHSECTHTMISEELYTGFLMDFDIAWSETRRPFGIHYCGTDPHRFGDAFAGLPHLDFLDLGWGGKVAELRQKLPATFFSIRLSPVEVARMETAEIEKLMRRLASEAGDPALTGFCCINMDRTVPAENVSAILSTAAALRRDSSPRLR